MNSRKILKVVASISLLVTLMIPDLTFAQSFDFTIDGTAGKNKWKTSDVTITATTVEKVVTSIQVDEGTPTSFSESYTYTEEGKHFTTVYWTDEEGKQLGKVVKKIKLDKSKPIVQIQAAAGLSGENGWLRSDAEISIGAEDPISKLIRVDFGLDTQELKPYVEPVQETKEGTHYVIAEAEDNAGNVEKIEQPFYIDKTKPIISDVYLQNEYFWGQDFPIQFQATDAISGVNSIKATINGKDVTNGTTYTFTEPGWHTYRIEVKDTAGWQAVYETKFEVYIPAKITFHPDSLQLDHGTGMATNFIELPAPFPPESIKFSTVMTNGKIVHVQDPQYGYVKNPIGDEDQNGIRDMMLKYERESLVPVIVPLAGEDKWKPTQVTMYGEWDVYHFKGYDDFRVLNSGYIPPDPDVVPPVATTQPSDGAQNVSVDISPLITFSEPVLFMNKMELTDASAASVIQFTNSNGENIPFTANWMKNTSTIQINPNVQLVGNMEYTIQLAENSVMDAFYNTVTKLIEGVGNLNSAVRFTFTTEQYELVMPPPLPIPVIEVEPPDLDPVQPQPPTAEIGDPPGIAVSPVKLPLPPKPPVLSREWQVYLNGVVEREISNEMDEEVIINEVNRVIDTLETTLATDQERSASRDRRERTNFDKDAAKTNYDVFNHTVTTVMGTVADKMAKGEVDPKKVVNSTYRLFMIGDESLLEDLEPGDSRRQKENALKAVSNLFDQVISKMYTFDISHELAMSLNQALNPVIQVNTIYNVSNQSVISDVAKIKKNIEKLEDVRNDLGDKAVAVGVSRDFPVYIRGKQNTKVTIQPKVLKEILSNNLSLSIQNQDHAALTLPPEWLGYKEAKKLEIVMDSTSFAEESDNSYEYRLKIDGKEVQEIAEEVTIQLPVQDELDRNAKVYYYDEDAKKWSLLRDKNGKEIVVELRDGVVIFKTKRLGTFSIK